MSGQHIEESIANKTIGTEDEMFQNEPETEIIEEEPSPVDPTNPDLTEEEALAYLGVKEWDEYPPIETFSYYEAPNLVVVDNSDADVILEHDEDYLKLIEYKK